MFKIAYPIISDIHVHVMMLLKQHPSTAAACEAILPLLGFPIYSPPSLQARSVGCALNTPALVRVMTEKHNVQLVCLRNVRGTHSGVHLVSCSGFGGVNAELMHWGWKCRWMEREGETGRGALGTECDCLPGLCILHRLEQLLSVHEVQERMWGRKVRKEGERQRCERQSCIWSQGAPSHYVVQKPALFWNVYIYI